MKLKLIAFFNSWEHALLCVSVSPCAQYLTACVSAHGQMYSNRLVLVSKLLNVLPLCIYLSSRDSMFL